MAIKNKNLEIDVETKTDGTPERILKDTGINIYECWQCAKCSSGCPCVESMDIPPHRIVRLLQLNRVERVIESNALWTCSGCRTCAHRCPNDIPINQILDWVSQNCRDRKRSITKKGKNSLFFHRLFLHSVKRTGKLDEAQALGIYQLKTGSWKSNFKMGLQMFLKGRLKPFVKKIRDRQSIKSIFKK